MQSERLGLRTQCRFLRPTSHQQHAQSGVAQNHSLRSFEQQMQTFVMVEGTHKPDYQRTIESHGMTQARIRLHTELKRGRVDCIGDDGHTLWRYSTLNDVVAQPFTNGRDLACMVQGKALERTRKAIAQATLDGGAVVHGCILP